MAFPVAAVAILIWGGTPAATLIAVREIDPGVVGIMRTLITAVAVLPMILVLRLRLPTGAAGRFELAIGAIAGFIAFPVLFSVGMAQTSVAHAALIIAAAPVFTGLIGFLWSGGWPRWVWWVGAAIALSGEALLIGSRATGRTEAGATVVGDLIVLASVIATAAGYVAGARLAGRIGTWAATSWSLVLAGAILAVAGTPALLAVNWADLTAPGLGGLVYLSIGASLLGYAAWYWALGRAGAAKVAPLQFAQPVVSLVIAVLAFGERLTLPVVMATALILAGVVVCRWRGG